MLRAVDPHPLVRHLGTQRRRRRRAADARDALPRRGRRPKVVARLLASAAADDAREARGLQPLRDDADGRRRRAITTTATAATRPLERGNPQQLGLAANEARQRLGAEQRLEQTPIAPLGQRGHVEIGEVRDLDAAGGRVGDEQPERDGGEHAARQLRPRHAVDAHDERLQRHVQQQPRRKAGRQQARHHHLVVRELAHHLVHRRVVRPRPRLRLCRRRLRLRRDRRRGRAPGERKGQRVGERRGKRGGHPDRRPGDGDRDAARAQLDVPVLELVRPASRRLERNVAGGRRHTVADGKRDEERGVVEGVWHEGHRAEIGERRATRDRHPRLRRQVPEYQLIEADDGEERRRQRRGAADQAGADGERRLV